MAYSIQTAVSDGNLAVLDLSIKYMDKSHIFVYVDDVLVDGSAYSYVWLTDTRIQLVPKVAAGSTLKVVRKTLTDEMWHEFSKGARFSTSSMDDNFEQLLFLAQEYSEGIYVSDFYSDVDLHLKRILHLGDPINDGDAVNLKTLKEYLPNAELVPPLVARIAAEELKSTQLSMQGVPLANKTIANFDATGLVDGAWVHIAGRDTVGDGGGGRFRYTTNSTQVADGVYVFDVTGGKVFRDSWTPTGPVGSLNPAWAGVKYNSATFTDSSVAMQRAITVAHTYGIPLKSGGGRIYMGSKVYIPQQSIFGKTRAYDFGGATIVPLANITLFESGYFNGGGNLVSAIGLPVESKNCFGIRFGNFTVDKKLVGDANFTAQIVRIQDWHQGCAVHKIYSNFCETILYSNNSFYCEFDEVQTILDVVDVGTQPRFLFAGTHNLNVFRKLVGTNAPVAYQFNGPVISPHFEDVSIEGVIVGAQFNADVYGGNFASTSYIENFTLAFEFGAGVHGFKIDNAYVNFLGHTGSYLIGYNSANASSSIILGENIAVQNMPSENNWFATKDNTANRNNLMIRRKLVSTSSLDDLLVNNTIISTQAQYDANANMAGLKAHIVNKYAVGNYSGQYTSAYANSNGFDWVNNGSNTLTIRTRVVKNDTQRVYVNIKVLSGAGDTIIRGEFVGNDFFEFGVSGVSTKLTSGSFGAYLQIDGGFFFPSTITGCVGEVRLV